MKLACFKRQLTYYIYEYHLLLNIYFITEPEERCRESHTFILLCINYSILPFLSRMFSVRQVMSLLAAYTATFALIGGYRATGFFQQGTCSHKCWQPRVYNKFYRDYYSHDVLVVDQDPWSLDGRRQQPMWRQRMRQRGLAATTLSITFQYRDETQKSTTNRSISLNGKKSLMVASRVERSYPHFNKRLSIIQPDSDNTIIIFGINKLGVFGRGI